MTKEDEFGWGDISVPERRGRNMTREQIAFVERHRHKMSIAQIASFLGFKVGALYKLYDKKGWSRNRREWQ